MERTPKNIDEILRERLYAAAPPPPAFVWDNVAHELQKRNRRKWLLWLFFSGIAGVGMLGIWFAKGNEMAQNAMKTEPKQIMMPSQVVNKASSVGQTMEPAPSPKAANAPAAPSVVRQVVPLGRPALTTNRTGSKSIPTAQISNAAAPIAQPQKTVFEEEPSDKWQSLAILPQYRRTFMVNSKAEVLDAGLLREKWPDLLKPVAAKAKAKKAVRNCYDFSRQPSAWIIDAHLGPSLAQREMTANPDDKPYLVKRLSTEQRDLAFNAGIRATLMLKGNFLLRAGVQYEQMTEVFEFIDPDYVKYHVEITTQNGMTTIDTVGVDYGERYQKTYNRFGMLDIPLAAGIELRKGRSGFNINAGLSFNMLFWKRGAILSPGTGEPAWFTPQDGTLEVFRQRTGLSATASIQWFYHLTPRLRVFVEPYYKKIMRPVTLNSHPVEQRYGLGGLRLGMSKILN